MFTPEKRLKHLQPVVNEAVLLEHLTWLRKNMRGRDEMIWLTTCCSQGGFGSVRLVEHKLTG
eukprot:2848572-Amphidinium_carterae.1